MVKKKLTPFSLRLVAATLLTGATLAAARCWPLDGHAHASLLQLAGRLHPVLLHFPVALLLVLPLFEFLARRRPALGEAAALLLALAVPATFLAALAGLALAHADGHEGSLLTTHRLGGLLLTATVALAWACRPHFRRTYLFLLAVIIGLLSWTAHNGGSLTHGADYLTQPLPARLKKILRIPEAPAPDTLAPDTVFATAVHPILEQHCFTCHGPEKQKGDYRMDTFAALLAGGKSGHPAITPSDLAHSELIRRLLLGRDDDKVMPPRAKPRLKPAELALLQWWIAQGAARDLLLKDAKDLPPAVATLLASPATKSPGEPAVAPSKVDDYSAHWPQIRALEKSLGIQLLPVSRHLRDGLILRPTTARAHFDDAALAQLLPLAPYLVEAELSRTTVTDAALATLQQFPHLARLHLDHTALTGATLAELRPLTELTYLNLSATALTDAALAQLPPLPALREIYLFASQVTPTGRAAAQAAHPTTQFGPVDSTVTLAAPPVRLTPAPNSDEDMP